MVIDHFALAVYRWLPNYDYNVYFVLRKVGRLAFPIYCFLLVEGFFHTKNVAKYFRNCFLFAVISELPFNMAVFGKVVYPKGQNVYFTLCIGLCALILLEKLKLRYEMKYILLRLVIIAGMAYAGGAAGGRLPLEGCFVYYNVLLCQEYAGVGTQCRRNLRICL